LRTENEYQMTLKLLELCKKSINQDKINMRELGLSDEQIEPAIQPSLCFTAKLEEEIEEYEKAHKETDLCLVPDILDNV